jgi:hypothetical protein
VRALHRLGHGTLPDDPHALTHTLACLLKTREDRFQLGPDRVRQVLEGQRSDGVAVKTAGSTAGLANSSAHGDAHADAYAHGQHAG